MKLCIASDIHGSAYWCQKLLERYRDEKADRLLLLGDLLYHGPRNDLPREYDPKRVIAMLNPLKNEICCVRGNCEAEVDQMVLDFPVLADYALLLLGERTLFMTHGHHFNAERLPPLKKGDILLHGHTHVRVMEEKEDYILLNPGSVSIPKGDGIAGYMTYENGLFRALDMEGNELSSLQLK